MCLQREQSAALGPQSYESINKMQKTQQHSAKNDQVSLTDHNDNERDFNLQHFTVTSVTSADEGHFYFLSMGSNAIKTQAEFEMIIHE